MFIATRISRAITDATLKSALYSELKRHVPLAWEESGGTNINFKLAVICTRSEVCIYLELEKTHCGLFSIGYQPKNGKEDFCWQWKRDISDRNEIN